jgi:transketolase
MTVLPTQDKVRSVPRKTPLDPAEHATTINNLELAAVTMRRKIVEMGYDNHIRLHYGALMSITEIMTLLYLHWLKVKPDDPQWGERDRFVLSKGHGAPALYVALWMCGFFDESHFSGFRRLNSILQGHPDRLKTPGVDCTTGSLGQGFPVACGMALGAKVDDAPYRVYALIGDGECNEGSIWEAAQIAANLNLDRLTVLMDWNKKSSYGWMAGRNDIEPLPDKWRAFNWKVLECDGHDFVSLSQALHQADAVQGRPAIVLCHTIKGKGIPYVENYPTKPNILLTEAKYQECLAHLDTVERELQDGGNS